MYMKFTQTSTESQRMINIMKEYFNVAVMYNNAIILCQELEAAVLILQRNIDLEKQIWKCLENLKSVLK